MVELAIVTAVVFLPMMFGTIEFGRLVFAKTTITAAAREGVRFAIVRGNQSPAPTDSAGVASYVTTKFPQLSPLVVKPKWLPDNSPGSTVTVQVKYTYVPIVSFPFLPSRVVTSTSQQIVAY